MAARIYYEAIGGEVQTIARDDVTIKESVAVAYDGADDDYLEGVENKVAIPIDRVEQILYDIEKDY